MPTATHSSSISQRNDGAGTITASGDHQIAAQPAELGHQKGDAAAGHGGAVQINDHHVGRVAHQQGQIHRGGVDGGDVMFGEGGHKPGGPVRQDGGMQRGAVEGTGRGCGFGGFRQGDTKRLHL